MNGNDGELGEPLSLEDLLRVTTDTVTLPRLTEKLGKKVAVTYTVISRAEYWGLMPPLPDEAKAWDPKEFRKHEVAYLSGLTQEQRANYVRRWREITESTCVVGAINPRLTTVQARHLGDDADVLATAILRLSGIIQAEQTEAPAAPTEEAPAPS
jgi:hypothetical protein